MNWKLHLIVGIASLIANTIFSFLLSSIPSLSTLSYWFVGIATNWIPKILIFLLVILFLLRLIRPIPLKAILGWGIFYIAIFYISGFLGEILWLWKTNTPL